MNGFTKEELNILYTFIANIDWSDYEKIEDMFNIKNKLNQIHNKIKSMIDNYSEPDKNSIIRKVDLIEILNNLGEKTDKFILKGLSESFSAKSTDTACKEVFLENHKEFLDKTSFREILKNDDIGK